MNKLAIFKKPILSVMLTVLLTGLTHSSVSAMNNSADLISTPESAANQPPITTTTTTTQTTRTKRAHDDSVALPELKHQKVAADIAPVCINDILPDPALLYFFKVVTGNVKFQDDPIKNLVSFKILCKTVLPVCKRWRALAIFTLKLDLEKMLELKENELFYKPNDTPDPVDDNTKLLKLCLAKRVLNSLMHDAKIVWYTRVLEYVQNKFWRTNTIQNQFDTNTYFKDLSQAVTPMHARCMANNEFTNSLTPQNLNDCNMLAHCIHNHKVKEVKLRIILGAPLNRYSSTGKAALHSAAQCFEPGTVEIVTMLLEAGADVNATDRHGQTPILLHISFPPPNTKICKQVFTALIKYGAECNGKTLLTAIKYGLNNLAIQMIRKGIIDLNCRDDDGFTPLCCAIKEKLSDVAIELIRCGANPNITVLYMPPLFGAIFNGMDDVAHELIQNHANINFALNDTDSNVTFALNGGKVPLNTMRETTPLRYAKIKLGHPEEQDKIPNLTRIINMLIEAGAKIDQEDLEQLQTIEGVDLTKIKPDQIVQK